MSDTQPLTPDYCKPIIGYRAWKWRPKYQCLTNHGTDLPGCETLWVPGQSLKAHDLTPMNDDKCIYQTILNPVERSSESAFSPWGIHAFKTQNDFIKFFESYNQYNSWGFLGYEYGTTLLGGTVWLWGKIACYKHGYRCRGYGRIRSINVEFNLVENRWDSLSSNMRHNLTEYEKAGVIVG